MSQYYALYDKGWVIPENFCLGPILFSIVNILTGFFFRWPKTPENALEDFVIWLSQILFFCFGLQIDLRSHIFAYLASLINVGYIKSAFQN